MCPFFIKFSGMKSVCCVDFIIIDDAYLIRTYITFWTAMIFKFWLKAWCVKKKFICKTTEITDCTVSARIKIQILIF